MIILFPVFVFVFGLGVGSFLNVLIDRTGRGESLLGRSYCESCGKMLSWFELLPVVSFIFQKGQCRSCGTKLSWQYPLVELATGLTFLAVFGRMVNYNHPGFLGALGSNSALFSLPLIELLFAFGVATLFLAILVYDFRHKIIPNEFSYTLAAVTFLGVLLPDVYTSVYTSAPLASTIDPWHLAAGPILAAPFAFLWYISSGRWMGLGDAKLTLSIGWLLGVSGGLTAIVLGFWAGAIVGVALIILERSFGKLRLPFTDKKITMKSELPLAPFLIFGLALVFFFDLSLWGQNIFLIGVI